MKKLLLISLFFMGYLHSTINVWSIDEKSLNEKKEHTSFFDRNYKELLAIKSTQSSSHEEIAKINFKLVSSCFLERTHEERKEEEKEKQYARHGSLALAAQTLVEDRQIIFQSNGIQLHLFRPVNTLNTTPSPQR